MRNKLVVLLTILCLFFGTLPALADNTVPPEIPVVTEPEPVVELPPVLASDYIANITFNYAHQVQRLPGGNLLLSRVGSWDPGVIEVDREGKEVWFYRGIQPNSSLRLANGNTLVADSGAPGAPFVPRVVEFKADGKKAWEYILPSLAQAPRYAERLSNGNTLMVLPFEIREVTPDKKVVWQYGPGKPSKPGEAGHLSRPIRAHRLANGNTLIVDRGYQGGRVIEVNPAKKVVWHFSAPAAPAKATGGEDQPPVLVQPINALRLADGTTLITDKRQDLLFLVDNKGKVVEARTWVGLYKTAPVTDLWFAEPYEGGNVLLAATMVTGRTRVAEVVYDSMKLVWPKPVQ